MPDRKAIPGFEGRYEASTDGVIYSLLRRKRPISQHFVGTGSTCYAYVGLRRTPKGKTEHFTIHGLVLLTFRGPKPTPRHQGAHLNCDSFDNRLSNLVWATPQENAAHSIALGRNVRGNGLWSARLTDGLVRSLRARHANGEKLSHLAKELQMDRQHLRDVIKGRAWKHVS